MFLKSRIGIDFSTFEKANENWEKLIRLLHGKPLYVKPALGKTPSYITNSVSTPLSPVVGKFETLKSALLSERKGISLYRNDFLDACFQEADQSRVRQKPDNDALPSLVLETCGKLKPVRNTLIDWIMLEGRIVPEQAFTESLENLLERLRATKTKTNELSSFQDEWFAAHGIFAYETFLYLAAALLKLRLYSALHEVFTSHYFCPVSERNGSHQFETFRCFWVPAYDFLQAPLNPQLGHRFTNTVGEIVHRQADRSDIPFQKLIEAEFLVMLMYLVTPALDYEYWHPHTFCYGTYSANNEFFIRASQHKFFKHLAVITGINTADELRATVNSGIEKDSEQRRGSSSVRGLWDKWNMNNLDSIK